LIQKYGVSNPSLIPGVVQKREKTCVERYGVSHPQKLTEVKEKTKRTNVERYGVPAAMCLLDTQKKAKRTNVERYGVEFVQQNEQIREKTKQTNAHKYGRDYPTQTHIPIETYSKLDDIGWLKDQHHTQRKALLQIATELGFCENTPTNSGIMSKMMRKHGIDIRHYFQSSGERELCSFIASLGVEMQTNCRTIIPPKEVDIYIPDFNLAIEYNGLYWHSEQQGKDKWYHHDKWSRCKKHEIQLIQIFEDEWIHRKDQVKSKLKSLLGKDSRPVTYARTCSIVSVSSKEKKQFFEDNHLQGNGPGTINIGLTSDDTLVACMSFIRQRDCYYLNRYATSHRVPGGFGKLLAYFQKNYNWTKIISFADLRWSDGNLYEKTGWKLDKIIPPDYSYKVGSRRVHKFNFRRKYLGHKLEKYVPALSERENCDNNGILRLWDCGKLRYVLTQNEN